ncbi:MAG: phenylacetate-CoA oxygenase/reductase subunit PaaK [Burkholderiales bacterium]|nr:phenylacetate-CoA oxygenase/reductase subunit PaaK [Burkholderiales bacterium]
MTPQFHTLTISEVRRETADAISVRFAVPAALRDAYRFAQGQFVTLKATVDGEELRRSYSVCCAVSDYLRDGELRVGIKKIDGGRFSAHANATFSAGMTLEVMTPDGRFFTPLDASRSRHHVGFAGGSGITPMLSIIKTTLETEPASRFTLVYGNRAVGAIMFAEELEDLKNRYLGRLSLYHVISDEPQEVELFHGLMDAAKCAQFLDTLIPPAAIDAAFICGPAPMMDAAEAALLAAGVARERIHVERFGTPLPQAGPRKRAPQTDGPVATVHVIQHGKERVITVPMEGEALLDAGLAAGLDLPYACKGGVCCTCRARVLEGEVRMERNYTLEAAEMAKGFVLTCQSHPLTPKVVVSYDER